MMEGEVERQAVELSLSWGPGPALALLASQVTALWSESVLHTISILLDVLRLF